MYEVHDYIKSYLGETKDAHDFAKQFLDKRQKVKSSSQLQQHVQVHIHMCYCRLKSLLFFSRRESQGHVTELPVIVEMTLLLLAHSQQDSCLVGELPLNHVTKRSGLGQE